MCAVHVGRRGVANLQAQKMQESTSSRYRAYHPQVTDKYHLNVGRTGSSGDRRAERDRAQAAWGGAGSRDLHLRSCLAPGSAWFYGDAGRLRLPTAPPGDPLWYSAWGTRKCGGQEPVDSGTPVIPQGGISPLHVPEVCSTSCQQQDTSVMAFSVSTSCFLRSQTPNLPTGKPWSWAETIKFQK